MSQCYNGVVIWDPFDTTVWNCIIDGCTNGVVRTGLLSTQVGYNCFFNNQTNFIGYPANYGQIVMVNNNGTPCDIAFNIIQNPSFLDITNYYLSSVSPCVDAGDPAGAYLDGCFPPSQGTTINDMGPYGGPGACSWVSSTNAPFSLDARSFVGVTINPSSPGRYRLDYTDALGNTNIWTQMTNVDLLGTPWTFIDFDSPNLNQRFYRAVLLP